MGIRTPRSLKPAARLSRLHLHGPVVHLRLDKSVLYAATELGDRRVVDLKTLDDEYCRVMREIWREVPAVWVHAGPRSGPPPPDHRCSR